MDRRPLEAPYPQRPCAVKSPQGRRLDRNTEGMRLQCVRLKKLVQYAGGGGQFCRPFLVPGRLTRSYSGGSASVSVGETARGRLRGRLFLRRGGFFRGSFGGPGPGGAG